MTADEEFHKVFCGNFEYETDLREIERLFSKYGELSHVDLKTGFCFVYFKYKSDGQASIDDLDGVEYGRSKRKLKLEWAKGDGQVKLREERRRANVVPNCTLFVVNFDVDTTTEDDLTDMFEVYGPLERVQLKKNFGFVQFKELEDAKEALAKVHGTIIKSRRITVEYVATTADDRRSSPPRRDDRRGYDREPPRRDDRESYLRGPSNYDRGSMRERSPPPYRRREYSPAPVRRRRYTPPPSYRRSRSPPPYRRSRSPPPYRRSRSPPPYRRSRSPPPYRRRSYSRD